MALNLKNIQETYRLTGVFNLPTVFWIALWFGINTGPTTLWSLPHSLIGWSHYIRTAAPFLALGLVFYSKNYMHKKSSRKTVFPFSLKCWHVYGCIGVLSSFLSLKVMDALYWSLLYLCVFIVISVYINQSENALKEAIELNYLSWFMATIFLVIMIILAREKLIVEIHGSITSYGILDRVGSVGGMILSRSSGMARFAAVPCIISYVEIWSRNGWKKALWVFIFLCSASLIWFMQSRGAILSLGVSLSYITIFYTKRTRFLGILLLIILGSLAITEPILKKHFVYYRKHIYRDARQFDDLRSMSGRTYIWKKAISKISDSPYIGWGPQADRVFLRTHVHNSYLYALLQSGILGLVTYTVGLVSALWIIFIVVKRKIASHFGQKKFCIQCSAILIFFAIRSIPEVCGAVFGVDLMLMAPALLYFGLLYKHALSEK